jgi:hypothetical protein
MGASVDALKLVTPLADWSPWGALGDEARKAPPLPGVYLARSGAVGPLLYVGHAGERAASQPGLRGRLGVYARGRGAVSGLGEAALDRALADPIFVRQRLHYLEQGRSERARDWARAALAWTNVHVSWTVTEDKISAKALEERILIALDEHDLWNRLRPRLQ